MSERGEGGEKIAGCFPCHLEVKGIRTEVKLSRPFQTSFGRDVNLRKEAGL
jgi:hypothetical protein